MKKNKFIIAILIIALICLGVYLFLGKSGEISNVSFETIKAERKSITKSVTATGTIEAVTKVDVGTQVSGIISKIYVDYNDEVRRGQVIAELDKTNLLSELNSSKANLSSAKSDLDYNELNYKRMNTLHEKGLISDNECETAYLAYQKARQTYAFQQEALKRAQTNLNYAIITSPIDGVILSRDVEEGQTVAASFNTPTLFTIAQDLTDMRVIANVDEADIGEVKKGQRATFTVDAFPNDSFEGEVTQVRQNGQEENNVVTYEVVISAPNPDLKLKPSLTANVNIFTLETDSLLSIPTKALRFSPTREILGKEHKITDCDAPLKVWVKTTDGVKAIPIQTGISNGTQTEITEGLSEGTEIIIDATRSITGNADKTAERSPFAPGPPRKKK